MYTHKTPSLRALNANTNVLNTKTLMIYPGNGNRNDRVNIIDYISESVPSEKINELENNINTLNTKNYVYTDTNNTFTGENTFEGAISIENGGITCHDEIYTIGGLNSDGYIQACPLGANTILGAPAYGLHVSHEQGVQIWGTHFLQGDEWSKNTLKIQHNELGLFGDHLHPISLTFDNANVVNFKVKPDDGSTANAGQGAIFDFQAWQNDDATGVTMNSNCPVQILKNNSGSLVDRSVLNLSESDSRYSQLQSENTLTETNTFEKTIIAEDGVHASGGDVVISSGVLTFEDLVDGTVVERSGAGGYQYVQGMPVKFENGVCYDIGTISNSTNLSNIKFTGEGRLVQTCELWFTTPATAPTAHKWPTDIYWIDSATGAAPTLIASKNYRIVLRQEPNKIIASIAYIY
jgi:hypothetical protein